MTRFEQMPFVMEEVTDPVELAKAFALDARFEKNWAWFEAHAAEIYAPFSSVELHVIEAAGFADRGKAPEGIKDGRYQLGGAGRPSGLPAARRGGARPLSETPPCQKSLSIVTKHRPLSSTRSLSIRRRAHSSRCAWGRITS